MEWPAGRPGTWRGGAGRDVEAGRDECSDGKGLACTVAVAVGLQACHEGMDKPYFPNPRVKPCTLTAVQHTHVSSFWADVWLLPSSVIAHPQNVGLPAGLPACLVGTRTRRVAQASQQAKQDT